MFSPFNPRLIAGLVLVAFLAFSHLTAYRKGAHSVRVEWDAANVASERAAQEQAARMRDLQRQAELKYVVTREAQDRFQVVTVKEVHESAAPLAACPVPDAVRLRLNAAALCARDPAAHGCANDKVPDAR